MAGRNEILRYTFLPGIVPRLMAFFRSGFVHMAYMMAIIYANVRLLPPGHPYLQPENIGRYGIRHVITEASRNLQFNTKNIDQVIIYFTILAGLILLIGQFALLIVALMAEHPAYALGYGIPMTELFANPSAVTGSLGPDHDIAFIVMDRVFGIGDGTTAWNYFNSCVSNLAVPCTDLQGNPLPNTPTVFPFPFHLALHRMLQFYSMGIFIVGVFVIIYFMTTIVAETAQTGTPFGQRFNKAWAPIRFIVFFALILPLNLGGGNNEGLNAGQLITFKIVQMGSNMATNAWAYFNNGAAGAGLSASYLSQQYDIVAQPKIPEVSDLLKNIYMARACAGAYHLGRDGTDYSIDAYLVRSAPPSGIPAPAGGAAPNAEIFSGTPYAAAVNFAMQGNIIIRFGHLGATPLTNEYKLYKGSVKPYCGEVTLQIQGIAEPGANTIFEAYYNMVQTMWLDNNFISQSECIAQRHLSTNGNPNPNCATPLPTKTWALSEVGTYTGTVQTAVQNGITDQRTTGVFNLPPGVMERGWGGAAIWYNRIAAMNGAVTTATLNIPKLSRLPFLMEIASRSNLNENAFINYEEIFNQNMSDAEGLNVLFDIEEIDRQILSAMVYAHDFWVSEGEATQSTNFEKGTGNIVIDFINLVIGTSGLFEMRDNTNVHPLAQLSAIGKGMMEATVRNIAGGIVLGGASGIGLKQDSSAKILADSLSSFLFAMALTTLGIAAILYYVLPFLPFIYFLFAISGWVKSIFEAIVAIPLWALAHLRIDGEGLPGPGASNGYFLLLEIFLRPILIIFGFVASISIFTALVSVLNQIFDIIVANVGGFDYEMEAGIQAGTIANVISELDAGSGPVDEFFFTAMYAIICYLMGMASFKLVDLIPNNILRWMGVSVSTFQENAGDPAGQLTSNVYRGSILVGNQIQGNVKGDLAAIVA